MLIYHYFDRPFLLQTDVSWDAIGAILSQVIKDREHVVAYASHRLSIAEGNYDISDKEGLAVVFGVKQYHSYLLCSQFAMEIDHALLLALMTLRDLTSCLGCCALLP